MTDLEFKALANEAECARMFYLALGMRNAWGLESAERLKHFAEYAEARDRMLKFNDALAAESRARA